MRGTTIGAGVGVVGVLLAGALAATASAQETAAVAAGAPDDTYYDEATMRRMGIPEAWTWTTGSSAVTIAVVSTGVTPVQDLDDGRVLTGRDFVDADDDAADTHGQGTVVASMIAGQAGNGYGVAGVCSGCRILPVRVVTTPDDLLTAGTEATVAAGITWAADQGARIIAVPLATRTDSPALRDAVTHAVAAGSLIVASAGEAGAARTYPAADERVLAVGKVGRTCQYAGGPTPSLSDRWIDIAACYGLTGLDHRGEATTVFGTFGATAVVAGAAGLVASLSPGATPADIRDALVDSGRVAPNVPWFPVLDAARALHPLAPADEVPPAVLSTGLKDGQFLTGHRYVLRPAVSDDHAVGSVQLVVGGRVVDEDDWAPWELELPAPPPNVSVDWPVTVRAVDLAGNVAERTTVAFADSLYPAFVITPAPSTGYVRNGVPVTVTPHTTDIASVTIADVVFDARTTPGPWTVPMTEQRLGAPQGTIEIRVQDRAGNERVRQLTLAFDNKVPLAFFTAPAAGATVRGTFTTSLTVAKDTSGIAKAELWVDGVYVGVADRAPWSMAVSVGRKRGPMTLVWKVADGAGNVRTSTRVVTAAR